MIAAAVHRFWPAIAGVMVLIGAATLLWRAGFDRESAAVVSGHAAEPRRVDPVAD